MQGKWKRILNLKELLDLVPFHLAEDKNFPLLQLSEPKKFIIKVNKVSPLDKIRILRVVETVPWFLAGNQLYEL